MRVAVRRAGVLLDAGSGTLVNASRVDLPTWTALELRILPEFSVFRMFPLSRCVFPRSRHAPWSRHRLCARGANTNRSGASQTYDPLSPHRIDNRPHVIWIMVHAPNSTLHAPINSKTQLSLRRRGCCACGVRARTSFPRMTDGKNGGLGESVS